jgi:hypothetical protein
LGKEQTNGNGAHCRGGKIYSESLLGISEPAGGGFMATGFHQLHFSASTDIWSLWQCTALVIISNLYFFFK